jgi:hypothetical protein
MAILRDDSGRFVSGSFLQGANVIAGKISIIERNFPKVAGKALMKEFGIEKKEIIRVTPKDSGDLRSTIRVVGPEFSGSRITAYVTAGGSKAPYALFVHEDLHRKYRVGGPKYIERPLRESAPFMGARVARHLQMDEGVFA